MFVILKEVSRESVLRVGFGCRPRRIVQDFNVGRITSDSITCRPDSRSWTSHRSVNRSFPGEIADERCEQMALQLRISSRPAAWVMFRGASALDRGVLQFQHAATDGDGWI